MSIQTATAASTSGSVAPSVSKVFPVVAIAAAASEEVILPSNVVTLIGQGHACDPTTRCAAGFACYLLYVNGPLAGLGSTCQSMWIPRNNTLKVWLSERNEIDLGLIGNCVEDAYCERSSSNTPSTGQCQRRLEDRRGCTGHNQCMSGYCQYSVDAGHGVCMSGDGFLNESTYRALHVTLWLLAISALFLIAAVMLNCHRRRVKPRPTPSCAWSTESSLKSLSTPSSLLPPPAAVTASAQVISPSDVQLYLYRVVCKSVIASEISHRDQRVGKRITWSWRQHLNCYSSLCTSVVILLSGFFSLLCLIIGIVYMVIPWPYAY
ncbi:hypothetical protein BDF19DRAFT_433350 [Syncephalis fuscata]|nr:hypothetical protein BDF19DRAFT_433350 [Syncephalis fuscata]